MLTQILTFLTTRMTSVVITTVVVVVAVPVLIITIHGHTTIAAGTVASTSRQNDEQAQLIIEINQAGDRVIVKLNAEEAACDNEIAQLTAQSKLSPTATAAALLKGRTDFHAAVTPFVDEIQTDEHEADDLRTITPTIEQTYLARITEVQVVALGDDTHAGALVTFCQTVVVEIQQVIVVQAPPPQHHDDDIRLTA